MSAALRLRRRPEVVGDKEAANANGVMLEGPQIGRLLTTAGRVEYWGRLDVSAHCCCGRGVCGGELEPYLQSITGAGLDVRPVQQHVERIYDLVFVSLFNTISVVLRARERVRKERRQREKGGCVHLRMRRVESCSPRRSLVRRHSRSVNASS